MAKTDLVSVAVNLTKESLQKLHVISQVYRRPVGDLIREGVDDHIKKLSDSDAFRADAQKLQEQHSATIDELLKDSVAKREQSTNPSPNNSRKVTRFPGNRNRRKK
ncbi:MAG TPA: hypothetical protein VD998_04060 [Verrucomicrobiae bacterium]|nr:hypothetical protein [Verrucomicrobiae bacterium]